MNKTGEQINLKAVGEFFYGESFNEPAFFVAFGMNDFKLEKKILQGIFLKKVQSVLRWLTAYTPKQSGVYVFNVNPNLFSYILIDKVEVKNQAIRLEKGRNYLWC